MGSLIFSRQNPLLFRKDGALDFGPMVWACSFVLGATLLVLDSVELVRVSVAAWAYLGALTTITSIAGAYAERAYWIAMSGTPGAVAEGIASVGAEYLGEPPRHWDFDDPDA